MKNKKKIWIPIVAAVLVVAAVAGFLLIPRTPTQEVAVYAVSMVGYTDYYSGSRESYGMVTTDKIQTAFVTDTQTVKEILVYPGQGVKKGDVLYTYDTTLSDLAVERKDLSIQQLEVQLKTAQQELKALKAMKPIYYKEDTSTNTNKYTESPSDKNLLNTVYSTNTTGRSKGSPLYYWMEDNTSNTTSLVSPALIEYLFDEASDTRDEVIANKVFVVFQISDGNRTNTEFAEQYGVCFTRVYKEVPVEPEPTDPEPTDPEPTDPEPTDPEPTDPEPTDPEPTDPEPTDPEPTDPEPTDPEPTDPEPTDPEPTEPEPTDAPTEPTDGAQTPEEALVPMTEPTDPTEPSEPEKPKTEKVFDGYGVSFFEPSSVIEDNSSIDWNSGYTQAELTAMRNEKQAQINQLQFDIKMGKAELKIMKKEADSGQVLAEISGVVAEVLEPQTAMELGQPMIKVTGGGGYYVEGTVSELDLKTIHVGQSITVNAWDTGEVLQGTVVEIGQYPAEEQGYYYGSANVTFYPYKVFIDQSANLMEGYYVGMTYQTEESAEGVLYLQNAFLRKEGSRSYVFVRNGDGILEKRYLEVGISQDGYMTPIYGGLTEEDFVAFPYGNDVVDGAPTYEGTMDELYGY